MPQLNTGVVCKWAGECDLGGATKAAQGKVTLGMESNLKNDCEIKYGVRRKKKA